MLFHQIDSPRGTATVSANSTIPDPRALPRYLLREAGRYFPAATGVYVIWDGDTCLYVGLAEKRTGLKTRISKHAGGDIPNSTPSQVIFWDEIVPELAAGGMELTTFARLYRTHGQRGAAVREWIEKHRLEASFIESPKPRALESEMIRLLQPAMNRAQRRRRSRDIAANEDHE